MHWRFILFSFITLTICKTSSTEKTGYRTEELSVALKKLQDLLQMLKNRKSNNIIPTLQAVPTRPKMGGVTAGLTIKIVPTTLSSEEGEEGGGGGEGEEAEQEGEEPPPVKNPAPTQPSKNQPNPAINTITKSGTINLPGKLAGLPKNINQELLLKQKGKFGILPASGVVLTNCTVPEVCPSITCVKKLQLDETNAKNKELAALGSLLTGCNGNYFFSKFPLTYVNASTMCCSLGLRLVTVESGPKIHCLAKIHKDILHYEAQYWTSASYNRCKAQFWWCKDKILVPNTKPDIMKVIPVKYLNSLSCVFLNIKRDFLRTSFVVDLCSEKKQFICQKDEIITTTTESPTCVRPECPTYSACPKFKIFPNDARFEQIESKCGRKMYYSTFQANFSEAIKACCDLGMKLLSVETTEQRTCLIKSTSSIPMDKEILASATNTGCDKAWYWCGSEKLLDKASPWDSGQPTKYQDVYRCTYFKTEKGRKFLLSSMLCHDRKRFICEVNSS